MYQLALGTSPYVVDASTLTTGPSSITIRSVINGVVRGTSTQSFNVLERMLNFRCLNMHTHLLNTNRRDF